MIKENAKLLFLTFLMSSCQEVSVQNQGPENRLPRAPEAQRPVGAPVIDARSEEVDPLMESNHDEAARASEEQEGTGCELEKPKEDHSSQTVKSSTSSPQKIENSSVKSTGSVASTDAGVPRKLRITDRRSTVAFFSAIYGNNSAMNGVLGELNAQPVHFGLSLDSYERHPGTVKQALSSSGQSAPVPGAVREGFRVNACLKIHFHTSFAGSILPNVKTHVRSALGLSAADPLGSVTEAVIDGAYEVFHPGKKIAPSVKSAIQVLLSTQASDLDKWRHLLLSLCLDPYWQVI